MPLPDEVDPTSAGPAKGDTALTVPRPLVSGVVDGFAGVVDGFAGVVDGLLLDEVLLLLDEVLLPLCPPDLATGFGGIRQTLGEDQTDQGTGSEMEARIAEAAQVAWAAQTREAQSPAGPSAAAYKPCQNQPA